MKRILLYDSCCRELSPLREALSHLTPSIVSTSSLEEAADLFKNQVFPICIFSVENPKDLEAMQRLKGSKPETLFLVLSSNTNPNHVVQCIRGGASNFVFRGDLGGLIVIVASLLKEVGALPMEPIESPIPEFVGKHPRVCEIFRVIQSIKDSDSTVLITGESGTGKEIVAVSIHRLSGRNRSPWVAINCSAIPVNLLESELFGHVKGAFTGAIQNRLGRFQMAQQGTLFLDEIGDLTPDLQAKLLRAIQNKVFEPVGGAHSVTLEARIIAATNRNLEDLVAEKKFREDLFYRLNVIPIFIPPLRNRKSDIPLLVRAFIQKFAVTNRKEIFGVSEEAMNYLMHYQWPGNIRELENLIERVVVLKQSGHLIEASDLPVEHFRNVRLDRYVANIHLPEEGIDFNQAVTEFENELIIQALQKTAGNRNQAANLLNLNRTTLVEKLKRKGLRVSS